MIYYKVMMVILSIFYFTLGLILGSFINVFVARYKTGLGLKGRSFCFSCGRTLSWSELIPVLSFVFQKGRCKRCKTRISWQYPLVELVTGLVFVLIIAKLDPFLSSHYLLLATYYLLVFSILLAITFYDIRHNIIPDALVYFFIALSVLSIFLIHNSVFIPLEIADGIFKSMDREPALVNVHTESDSVLSLTGFIIQNLLAGPLLTLPLLALWFFSKGTWIGFGDVKLTLGIGWLLGFSGGVVALILAFWIGAATGVGLIALSRAYRYTRYLFRPSKRLTIKSEIPFAPFLVLGTLIAFLYDISFADIQSLFMF